MDSGVNGNKINLLKDITLSDISYSTTLGENDNVTIVDGNLYVTGSNAFTICIEKRIDVNAETGLTFMAELVRPTSNADLEVDYELYFGAEDSRIIKRSVDGNVLTGFTTYVDLSKVYLFISIPANSGELVIKNIQLFNDLYGSIYKYDASGLLIKETNTLTTKEYRYNIDNYNVLVRNKINRENSCIYNYDYRNRIKEILYSNGCSRHFEYDRDYVVRVVTKDGNGNLTEEKKSYYLTKTKPYQVTNLLGENINLYYDQNERLITNSRKENSYEEVFRYNSDLTLKEKDFYDNTDNKITHKYYYDSQRRLEKIVLNDAYSIKYSYDDYGNISSVSLFNDNEYTNFEKFNYEVNEDSIYTGNLKEHRIGKMLTNDNKYLYEYDNFDRLVKMYISNPTTNTLISEFEYDLEDKLIKIHDYKNDVEEVSEFIYNEYNNLCKVIKTKGNEVVVTEYKYNKDNEKVFVNNSVLGKKHYYGYTVDKKSKRSPLNVHNYFNNKSKEIYSNFLLMKKDEYVKTEEITYDASGAPADEGIVEYKDIYELNVIPDLLYGDKSIKLSDSTVKPGVSLIGNNNISAFRLLNNGVNLKYETENEYKAYSMWFKFNTLDEGNVVFAVDKTNSVYQKFIILLTEDNKIQLKQNINLTESIVLESSVINPYEWNFVCLSFGENSSHKLYVNESIYEFTSSLNSNTEEIIYFGYNSQSDVDTQNINGYVTCMTVSSLLTDTEVKELYDVINDNYIYFSKEESDNYNDMIVYTHNYKMKDRFSLIPLDNTFKCINNDINHKVYYKVNYEDINKSEFEYVDGFKKYGYCAVGNDLAYTGFMPLTLVFREFTKAYYQDQTLFEIIAGSNKIGLKINKNGLLIGYVNDFVKETDLSISANTVHNFKVGIKEVKNSSETVRRYNMNITIDGNSFNFYSSQVTSFSGDVKVHIGCKESGFDPLNGYIDMLYMGNTYDDTNDFTGFNLFDSVSKTVDTLGFLRSNEASHNNERVIKKEYKYKEETINNSSDKLAHGLTKCYNIIEEEVITLKDEERKILYGYNDNNLVQTVAHYTDLVKTKDWLYYYDDFNRVIGEFQSHNMNKRMYEYDMLGNITKKYDYEVEKGDEYNTVLFGYDTIWPDRLKTIAKDGVTKTVEYDSSLFGYPVAIGTLTDGVMTPDVTLEWKRHELKKYTSGTNEYTFNYNVNGQRISKVYNRLGDYIYKYYYYSNDLLVLEKVIDDIKGEEYTIEYLYDESSMLYGFIYGNKVYYYLKDILGNIIGIINEEGSLVCEYEYDAYGEHKVTNLIGNVGNINPFRYKGYYYDVETNLFLVSSRYYSPELCRWISPDDIEYLDPESVNGLNLYCYCFNDPVNYVDPDGHFPWLILAALLLFTPVGGTALQVATSALSYAGMAVASIFDKDIRNDMNAIGWNPFNTDESATLNSSKVSFYKGVPIFRTAAGGRSGSFGAIFLTKGSGVDTLRHERGHNWQLMMMGIGTYGFTVGIPSPAKLGKWDKAGNYYGAPWETMADILGGVKGRTHSKAEKWNAWGYYAVSTIAFPFTALYWF